MKILVTVKRVVDYNVKVRAKSDGSDVDIQSVKMSINPFDEHAVEEAVRLKEKGIASEIVVVSIGAKKSIDVIRSALAMGADRGVHILSNEEIEPLNVAKIVKKVAEKEKPDLILMGKQAIDNEANQTPQMLSGLMNLPQAVYASNIDIKEGKAVVTREVDDGLEIVEVSMPCVISADLRLNQPRYVKLPNIMKAKKKPVEEVDVSSFDIDLCKRISLVKVEEPKITKQVKMLDSVDELVSEIKRII
jgi:electron transfer flavoprotein beta subunit